VQLRRIVAIAKVKATYPSAAYAADVLRLVRRYSADQLAMVPAESIETTAIAPRPSVIRETRNFLAELFGSVLPILERQFRLAVRVVVQVRLTRPNPRPRSTQQG